MYRKKKHLTIEVLINFKIYLTKKTTAKSRLSPLHGPILH